MATQGTYSAYKQLKPLEGDVSQDIQQQEENGYIKRAEKRAEDEALQNRNDKLDKEKRATWDKYVKPLSNYDTGSTSLNEAQGRLLIEAQKQYVPLMAVINNPKASDDERLKATLKLQNINQLPDNLASMTKSLTDRDVEIRTGVQKGTLFPDENYNTNFQKGYENKLLALDENGMPLIAFKDKDGDGKDDFETYDQIQNVVPKYNFQKRYDRDQELLDASAKLQPEVTQTDDGTQRVKTTAINPQLLKDYVSSQLFELDGATPSDKLKSFAREAGVALTDQAGLLKLATNFENDIKLRVKGGTETTRNYNNLDITKEANAQKERDKARADRKTKEELDTNTVSVTESTDPYTGEKIRSETKKVVTKTPKSQPKSSSKENLRNKYNY